MIPLPTDWEKDIPATKTSMKSLLDDINFEYLLPSGCIPITQEEADLLIPKLTKTQLKNKEIKERTSQYKSDIKEIQSSWISAIISDGEEELIKKQQINIDLMDLKLEYETDILAIKSKYQI